MKANNYKLQFICYDPSKIYIGCFKTATTIVTGVAGTDLYTITIPSGYNIKYIRIGARSAQNDNVDFTVEITRDELNKEIYNHFTSSFLNLFFQICNNFCTSFT